MRLSSITAGVSLLALMSIIATPTAAQAKEQAPSANQKPSTPAGPAADDESKGVGDIIVTARKRSESLQSIPGSVAAVTGQGLEDAGVHQLGDISKQVSGLAFVAVGGAQPLITMRGDYNRVGTTEPGLGVFLDGVFTTRFTQFSQNPLDLARVELLKGPQSTLYGKNTVVGALNLVTADPTFKTEGYVEAGYGRSAESENIWHVQGVVSAPLVEDKLAIRIAASHAERDGFLVNPANGIRALGYRDDTIRAKLLFTPASNLRIKLTASYDKRNAPRGDALQLRTGATIPFANTALALPLPAYTTDPRRWSADVQPYSRTESWYTTGQIDLDTPFGTLTSITNYQWSKLDQITDTDTTQYAIARQNLLDRDKAFSQELRLVGSKNGFTWLGGLYYLNDQALGFGQRLQFLSQSANGAAGIALQSVDFGYTSKNYSAFGQFGVDLTDKLNILGGLRYGEDHRSHPFNLFFLLNDGSVRPGAILNVERLVNFSSVTGNVVATWKFDRNARIYASYSTGEKSGGFSSAAPLAAALLPFDQQKIKAYEIGLKSELFDRRVRLNLAAYYNDISGLQVQRNLQFNGAQLNLTQNAGSAKASGVDVELVGQVTPHFKINVAYSYVDSKIKDYIFTDTVTLHDLPIPRSPKHSGTVGVNYNTDLGSGKFDLGGNVVFRSGFSNDISFVAATSTVLTAPLPGYTIANLNGSYTWDRYQIRAFVNNLFDKHYAAAATIVAPTSDFLLTPGEPRTFEVSFRVSF